MKYPYQIFFGVTYKCNLNCKHCYVHKKIVTDIPLSQIKKLINDLASHGVIKLIFTHGESLIREDFEEIIQYAYEKGFYLTLLSNGFFLTDEKAKSLFSKGLNKVQISLDSLDSEYHNSLRRRPFAWEKAIDGIKNSQKNGLKTGINTTINRHNYNHLEDFIKFSIENKLEEIDFLMIRPSSDGIHDEYSFTSTEYRDIVGKIWDFKQKYQNKIIIGFHDPLVISQLEHRVLNKIERHQMIDENICQAGKLWVSILPNGDVQPCNFLPKSIGNAYQEDFDSILKKVKSFMKKEFPVSTRCRSCKYVELCQGGCKGFSFADKNRLDFRCNYLLNQK